MLWLDHNAFTIDVPKTGCKTRWNVGKGIWQERCLPGHHTVKKARYMLLQRGHDLDTIEFHTVIRHPFERFVSGLNFISRGRENRFNLNEFLASSHFRSYFIFKPAFQFLDEPSIPVQLWPMEHMKEMLREIGYTGEIPHSNRSPNNFSREEIAKRPDIDQLMERYVDDFALYEQACARFR